MSDLNFEIVKESDAPSPQRTRRVKTEYQKLFNAIKDMESDEVILISFDDERHYNRTAGMVRYYFGNGAYGFRRISKKEWKFILKPITTNDK